MTSMNLHSVLTNRARMLATATPNHFILPQTKDTAVPLALVDYSKTPTGSHKTHLASELISAGCVDGQVHDGTELVIDTSGNTGISAAYAADQLNLRFRAFVPKGTSPIKLDCIRSFGGAVVEVDGQDEGKTPLQQCNAAATAYAAGHDDVYHLDQFGPTPFTYSFDANIGREMINACFALTGQAPDRAFMGVGTGQSLMSLSRTVRLGALSTQITLVDIEGGLYDPKASGTVSKSVEGLNMQFRPACLSDQSFDRVSPTSVAEAQEARELLGRAVGLSVGLSSGLVLAAALKHQQAMLAHGKSGLLCCPLYDTGKYYGYPAFA